MAEVESLLIAVGSRNPAKLDAVHAVGSTLFRRFRVAGVEVGSAVPDQPRSDRETLEGAEHRARAALDLEPGAVYGVGIESGITRLGEDLYGFTWVAVAGRSGETGRGCSARIQLPPSVARALEEGLVLEEAMRRVTGARDLGRGQGAMGLLTGGAVTRGDATVQALHFAFARFANGPVYGRETG